MNALSHHLEQQLQNLQQAGLLRRLVPLNQSGGGRIVVSGTTYLNLSGNDYLGLAANRHLVSEFYSRISPDSLLDQFGPGASASRLMTGNSELYHQLEQKLASLYGKERALVFNSGYHGNVGILPVLAGKGDLILADKLCHASLIDGMRLSKADTIRYRHLDYDHLTSILEEKRNRYNRVFLVSESVFSMDGDLVDLHSLIGLKERFGCSLYLDEAHAVGVFGRQGLGLAEQQGVIEDIDLLFGTFGKALAGLGGFVVCSAQVADYLVNRARSFIYSTGLPPVCLSWLLFVLDRVPAMIQERAQLLEMAEWLRKELVQMGLTTGGTSQIIPVIIGDSSETLAASEKLQAAGFWATAVRPPTVPANTARLRLSLGAALQREDLAPLPGLIKSALG
jgi:8-amino-7-oxononanoate synthase